MNSTSVSPYNRPSGVAVHNHHILVWMMIIITLSTTGALLWHFYGPSADEPATGGSSPPPTTDGGGGSSGTPPPTTSGGGGSTTSPPATGGGSSGTPPPATGGGGSSSSPSAGSGSPEAGSSSPSAGSGSPDPYDNSSPFDGLLSSVRIMLFVLAGIVGLLLIYFAEYGPGKSTLYNDSEDEKGRLGMFSESYEGISRRIPEKVFGMKTARVPTSVVFFGLPIVTGTGIALMVAGLRGYDTPNEPMWITGLSLLAPAIFYILALAGQFIHRSTKFVLRGILVGVVMIGIALIVVGTTAYDKPNQTMWLTGSLLAFPALVMLVRVIDMGVKKISSRLDERDEKIKDKRLKKRIGSIDNTASVDEHVENLTSKQLLNRMTRQNKIVSDFEKKEKAIINKIEGPKGLGEKLKKLEGVALANVKEEIKSWWRKQSDLREKIEEGAEYIKKLEKADKAKHNVPEYVTPE